MGFLISFAIGRIFYSLIERRDKWFVILEIIASGVFVGAGSLLLEVPQGAIRGSSQTILFIVTSLASRVILPRDPIEARLQNRANETEKIYVGVIDFVWISVMGGVVGFIAFARGVPPFVEVMVPKGMPAEYYQKALDSTVFLLEKVIDGVFLTGGGLAGCMAILWAGEIWRKSSGKARSQYKLTTVAAIKMVVAYFITIFNALAWMGVPLYMRMNALLEMLKCK